MANKYDTMVSSIVDLVGGKENIRSFAHCVTRLRFNVKDKGLVDEAKIRELPGAVGTQWSGNQLQVIIGNDVENVYKQIAKANNLAVEPEVSAESADEKKKNIVVKLIEMLSGCVIPLVPILMGAGMIKVFYLLAVRLGILSTESSTYIVLDFVNNAAFYFLPVFAGATAAKKFGGSMSIGMLVGAMLIHPTFISAVSGGTALTIFGLPIYATSYTNSIFPVILSVWVMSKIENFLKKHVPEWLRAIAVPTLTLLIMIPVAFCVVAPIGAFMGTYLAKAIMFLYSTLGFLAYGIFGVLFPIMVMFGMHTALTPYSVQLMSTVGYEPCSIMSFVSTCTLTAISLAVAIRTKNENMRSTGYSCALTAFVGGVTEPAMFGIGLRFKKPFICALIGNFVGACQYPECGKVYWRRGHGQLCICYAGCSSGICGDFCADLPCVPQQRPDDGGLIHEIFGRFFMGWCNFLQSGGRRISGGWQGPEHNRFYDIWHKNKPSQNYEDTGKRCVLSEP